ncbi:hypothetical protein MNEG_3277 [Monoraphidium neglectum]|uniref:Uncharacterized protein n=1 Tax=Monoraphidium neglectum TaxID=145388 RepID=A0A0D2MW34_9CHLO|nr:hypothetical protein MNEG_3277 [Monoraphidium neglectum]KIZ04677.1 hypothetical protein MNEG_3277 [Monoraphidium neglectum]|eukprot:XP_013903696.1 hypothetical protein MNEG_3277 [Monoraphidium neglectum]
MSKPGSFVLERARQLTARLKDGEFELHEWRAFLDDLRGCPRSDDCRAAWELAVAAFPSSVNLAASLDWDA